jgi:signal transduction histidine kinase
VDHPEGGDPLRRARVSLVAGWPSSVWFAWALGTAALALETAATVIVIIGGSDLAILALLPEPVAAAIIGVIVATRRRGHPIGILFCARALAEGIIYAPLAYARAAFLHPGSLPFGQTVMWITSWNYFPATALGLLIFPLVFPDGRLLSRRWRPVLWAAVAYVPLGIAGSAFSLEGWDGWFGNVQNPYAVRGPVFPVLLDVANGWCVIVAIAALSSVALRWRRAGHVVRQQLKWFVVALPVGFSSSLIGELFPAARVQILLVSAISSALVALAIGLAVLRYRLYEIDILLSRAVVYGLLSACVAGLYLSVVAVTGGTLGTGSMLSAQVVATVVVAALLLPVRGRLQRRVDRLFFGDRGTPYAAMAMLGRRVEEATTAEPVLDSVVTVVAGSLRLPYAAVQLRVGDDWLPSASWGQAPAEVAVFPLTFQRETVGRLVVGQRAPRERLNQDDERLLTNLARQVAPAAQAVALRRALDASRTGLVTAREEERRRLRRDLHDGLGPTIAGLTLGLDTAAAMLAEPAELAELLCGLKAETRRAVADIRRIVDGLRPTALDAAGLGGALREEAARLRRQAPGLEIDLLLPGDSGGELPAAVEVAAYLIVTEAVTNVLRHASARRCSVEVAAVEGGAVELPAGRELRLRVHDDGAGMPEGWRAGVGITAIRERVAELGGSLTIAPGEPHGTHVEARLPLGGRC